MAALVEGHTENEDLPLLAERIAVSQGDEIALMERWLTERGEDVPARPRGPRADAGDADRRAVPTARRARAQRSTACSCERMITHHQGRCRWWMTCTATGGGLEPAADRFAREAAADQSIEIRRMQELLGSLSVTPLGSGARVQSSAAH